MVTKGANRNGPAAAAAAASPSGNATTSAANPAAATGQGPGANNTSNNANGNGGRNGTGNPLNRALGPNGMPNGLGNGMPAYPFGSAGMGMPGSPYSGYPGMGAGGGGYGSSSQSGSGEAGGYGGQGGADMTASGYRSSDSANGDRIDLATLLKASGVSADNGHVDWPLGLRILGARGADELRDQIDALLRVAASQASQGQTSTALLRELRHDIRRLHRLLVERQEERSSMPEAVFDESTRFLRKLRKAPDLLTTEHVAYRASPDQGRYERSGGSTSEGRTPAGGR